MTLLSMRCMRCVAAGELERLSLDDDRELKRPSDDDDRELERPLDTQSSTARWFHGCVHCSICLGTWPCLCSYETSFRTCCARPRERHWLGGGRVGLVSRRGLHACTHACTHQCTHMCLLMHVPCGYCSTHTSPPSAPFTHVRVRVCVGARLRACVRACKLV